MTLADPRVLKILTEAVRRAATLNNQTRQEILRALGQTQNRQVAILEVIARYRQHLTRILTTTRLAAFLSAMASVLPQVPQPSSQVATSATANPEMARTTLAMLPTVSALPVGVQEEFFAALLPEQAAILRGAVGAAAPPPSSPGWAAEVPHEPREPELRFPVIDEAVRELQERQALTMLEFSALVGESRERAFTVAGVIERDTIAKIQKVLTKQVAEGPSLGGFKEKVEAALGSTVLSPTRMEQVFRDGVQSAYSRGLDRILAHPVVGNYFPYEETIPILDGRTSEMCRICAESGIQGTGVYRADDPTWFAIKPPRHAGCRCGRSPCTVRRAARKGITEAIQWLQTGQPPAQPQWVPMPPITLEPNFQR